MKTPSLLSALLVLAAPALADDGAGTSRRALVVGIDAYGGGEGIHTGRRRLDALHGAVADARAFAATLERLGFTVALLTDAAATRQGILDGIAALADGARPGDLRVFYYAGHGSRVRNSLSVERDQLDESILPVDAGAVKDGIEVRDLRDKELAAAFDAIVDREAVLTAVFDSCHSGSVTRGGRQELVGRSRQAVWDERDVKDPARPTPPETRGALILSAAQDEQSAQEMGLPVRGVFTQALVAALEREGAPDLPARVLFLSVQEAVRRATRDGQSPVIAGALQRQRATLLEARPAASGSGTRVSVRRLGTGLVAESPPLSPLGVGTLLERQAGTRTIRLVVDRGEAGTGVVPLAPAEAGDGLDGLDPQEFRVARWVVPREGMKVHVPPGMSEAQVAAARRAVRALRAARIPLVDDPIDGHPTHRLEALASGGGVEWLLIGPCVKLDASARGRDPVALLRRALGKASRAPACADRPARPTLFVQLAPPQALADRLRARWGGEGAPVKLVESPGDADYAFAGRVEGDALGFAFLRRGAPEAMPPRTDFFTTTAGDVESAGARLGEVGERLARSLSWLAQSGSDPVAQAAFPYQLFLRPTGGGPVRGDGATTTAGESYGLVLRSSSPGTPVPRRWVYVYGMSAQGQRQLLFPRPELGNVENRLPLPDDAGPGGMAPAPEEILLVDRAFDVSAPFGTDTLFLLATATELSDPLSLEDDGVRTRGGTAPGDERDDDAEDLLRGAVRRGMKASVPALWTLRKLTTTSRER